MTNENTTNTTNAAINESTNRAVNGYSFSASYSTDAIKSALDGIVNIISKLGAVCLEYGENEAKARRDDRYYEQSHDKELKTLEYAHEERMRELELEKINKQIELEELKIKNSKHRAADKSDKI